MKHLNLLEAPKHSTSLSVNDRLRWYTDDIDAYTREIASLDRKVDLLSARRQKLVAARAQSRTYYKETLREKK